VLQLNGEKTLEDPNFPQESLEEEDTKDEMKEEGEILEWPKEGEKNEAPSPEDQVTNLIPMVQEPLKSKDDESGTLLFQVRTMDFTPSRPTQLFDHRREIITRNTSLRPSGNEDSSSHETKSTGKRRCRHSKKEPREKKANLNKKLASQPQILDIMKESGFKGGTS